jgi:hypothetical protein
MVSPVANAFVTACIWVLAPSIWVVAPTRLRPSVGQALGLFPVGGGARAMLKTCGSVGKGRTFPMIV